MNDIDCSFPVSLWPIEKEYPHELRLDSSVSHQIVTVMGHRYTIYDWSDIEDMLEWCARNLTDRVHPPTSCIDPLFRFENEDDLLHFKMKWG